MHRLFAWATDHPGSITGIMLFVTVCLGMAAALPTLWPRTFPFLSSLKVDTDPENMLPPSEPVRLFHHAMRKEFSLHDMIVVGVVNTSSPDGVFNPESLKKVWELTEFVRTLHWPDKKHPGRTAGVIDADIIAPSTVDNIEQGGKGLVKFEWLMASPPETREAALAVRDRAERLPLLKGTLLSADGKALALYLPLTSKNVSYEVSRRLRQKIRSLQGNERYFITGLPVAEDTFGVEMFQQMSVSAPLAMLVIFLLLLYFFRKPAMVIAPMIVASVSVISTMGLLIITGNTVHIMSSMIPIFIMPIAVLDAIHILSEFFDRFGEIRDRRKAILLVMDTLSTPMLFTSLTTAVGFASLALTPIPPVQVFGLFVAFGVLVAWLWTVTFIPASIMFLRQKSLERLGSPCPDEQRLPQAQPFLTRLLTVTGKRTFRHARAIMMGTGILAAVSAWGISLIKINDNPVKWFAPSHPIRVADRVLNDHFGGTYMAYLALEAEGSKWRPEVFLKSQTRLLERGLKDLKRSVPSAARVFRRVQAQTAEISRASHSRKDALDKLENFSTEQGFSAPEDEAEAWDAIALLLDKGRQRDQIFKRPKILKYLSALQVHLLGTGVVGKSNSLTDIVKTVYRELLGGKDEAFRTPKTAGGVAQTLLTFQNSHRPDDLWHFVTPDFRKSSIWVQLKSGDNRDMSRVARSVKDFFVSHPPPVSLQHKWFGLTYINVIWQEKMVSGMFRSFAGSFLVVLLMMTLLFRSSLWGLLSMVPLLFTIGLIYGAIGFAGKDYDMPVAVLSSLSLGLAVDYAIHFLARSRGFYSLHGSWARSVGPVFGEPARAITRNAVVVGVGFLPLLATPLVPYRTVGLLIAAILLTAGVASLLILPAMITLLEPWLFPQTDKVRFTCRCGTCMLTAALIVMLVAINVRQFLSVRWTTLTWLGMVLILVLMGICYRMSKRAECQPTFNGNAT